MSDGSLLSDKAVEQIAKMNREHTRRMMNLPQQRGRWKNNGGGSQRRRVVIIGTLTAPTSGVPTTGIAAGLDYDASTKEITANDNRYPFYNFDPDLTAVDGTLGKIEVCDGIWDCYWVGCSSLGEDFEGLPEDPEA